MEKTAFNIVQHIEADSEGHAATVEQIVGDADLRKQVMQEMGRQEGLKDALDIRDRHKSRPA